MLHTLTRAILPSAYSLPRHQEPTGSMGSSQARKAGLPAPQTDVWVVSISLALASEIARPFDILWQGRGDDVPIFCRCDSTRNAFFVVGSSVYRQIGATSPPSYEPATDEIAPIPRADEDNVILPTKSPPYSWTQTSDSLTVAFPLPSDIPKSSIKVTLTARTLTLLIQTEVPSTLKLPRYSLK